MDEGYDKSTGVKRQGETMGPECVSVGCRLKQKASPKRMHGISAADCTFKRDWTGGEGGQVRHERATGAGNGEGRGREG